MRNFTLIITLFFLPALSQSARYIDGIEDIPIFKGMTYVEDSLVLFDKSEGRYVSSEITGDYKKFEIINFYRSILPNLGWEKIGPFLFKRGDEELEIRFSENGKRTSAIFSIYPSK